MQLIKSYNCWWNSWFRNTCWSRGRIGLSWVAPLFCNSILSLFIFSQFAYNRKMATRKVLSDVACRVCRERGQKHFCVLLYRQIHSKCSDRKGGLPVYRKRIVFVMLHATQYTCILFWWRGLSATQITLSTRNQQYMLMRKLQCVYFQHFEQICRIITGPHC